jgi:hypothetical protein
MITKNTPRVIEFVRNNPGCTRWAVAKFLRRKPTANPRHFYPLVNNQIRYGHIVLNDGKLYVKEA